MKSAMDGSAKPPTAQNLPNPFQLKALAAIDSRSATNDAPKLAVVSEA